MAIPPIVASLLLTAGSTLVGRIIGGKPTIPDLVGPAIQEARNALRQVEEQGIRAEQRLEAEAAAAGVASFSGGTAAREALSRAQGSAFADIRSSALDTITNARQRQEDIEAGLANVERQRRLQGVTNAASAIGTAIALGDTPTVQETVTTPSASQQELNNLLMDKLIQDSTAPVGGFEAPLATIQPLGRVPVNLRTRAGQAIEPTLPLDQLFNNPALISPVLDAEAQRKMFFKQLQTIQVQ